LLVVIQVLLVVITSNVRWLLDCPFGQVCDYIVKLDIVYVLCVF